jgi:hypothetical protein
MKNSVELDSGGIIRRIFIHIHTPSYMAIGSHSQIMFQAAVLVLLIEGFYEVRL